MAPLQLPEVELALREHRRRFSATQTSTKHASVAVILREREDVQVLLIKRTENPRDPWSGHMALPGGRVDPTDPGPFDAAVREAREEVGLELDREGTHVGELSAVQAAARGRRIPLLVHPFVFAVRDHAPLRPEPREVQATDWVSLGQLLDPARRLERSASFEGREIRLPYYELDAGILWGLTLRVLDELLDAIRSRPRP